MEDRGDVLIRIKFKPKTKRAKKAVKELKKFLNSIDIFYCWDSNLSIPEKGDFVFFSGDDISDNVDGYSDGFAELSSDAKKYFTSLCLNQSLRVTKKTFLSYLYITLLAEERFEF